MKKTLALLILILNTSCANQNTFSLKTADTFFKSPTQAALARAAVKGDINGINKQLEKGAQINFIGEYGMTALMWSAIYGERKGFEYLLKNGANPNIPSANNVFNYHQIEGNSVTAFTVYSKDIWFLETALQYGGDSNARNTVNQEPLVFQCVGFKMKGKFDGIEALKVLIKHKVNLNCQNKYGVTLMEKAALFNRYDLIYIMLKAGADPLQGRGRSALIEQMRTTSTSEDSELFQWRAKVVDLLHDKGIWPIGDNTLYQADYPRASLLTEEQAKILNKSK